MSDKIPSAPPAGFESWEAWHADACYQATRPDLEAYINDVQQAIADAFNGKPVTRDELKALLEKHRFKAEGLKE